MPRHHQPLTDTQRAAFSALMRHGREVVPLSLEGAGLATSEILRGWRLPDHANGMDDYVRWLEDRPSTPLANPHRLSAAMAAYVLCWAQVLEVLDVDRSVTLTAPVKVVGHPRHGRREPYTSTGISHPPCFRCGQPAAHQWQICADDGLFRPLCNRCDAALNELAPTVHR